MFSSRLVKRHWNNWRENTDRRYIFRRKGLNYEGKKPEMKNKFKEEEGFEFCIFIEGNGRHFWFFVILTPSMTQLWQTCGRVSRTFSTTIPEGSHYVNSSPFRRNGAILTIDNDAILIIDIAIKQTTIVIQSLVYSFPPNEMNQKQEIKNLINKSSCLRTSKDTWKDCVLFIATEFVIPSINTWANENKRRKHLWLYVIVGIRADCVTLGYKLMPVSLLIITFPLWYECVELLPTANTTVMHNPYFKPFGKRGRRALGCTRRPNLSTSSVERTKKQKTNGISAERHMIVMSTGCA